MQAHAPVLMPRGTAIELAMGVAVLVALGIGREPIPVAVLVRVIVLHAVLGEPVLARIELAAYFLLVDVGDLRVGDFARSGSASVLLYMMLHLLHDRGLSFGAVERVG